MSFGDTRVFLYIAYTFMRNAILPHPQSYQRSATLCVVILAELATGISMISGKGAHMFKGVGFPLLIFSQFLNYPMKMEQFGLTETK